MRTRHLLAATVATLVAVGACATTPEGSPMKSLQFGRDVKGQTVGDPQTLDGGLGPGALRVGVPTVRVAWGKLEALLVVENPSAAPVTVVVLPVGGAFPYGGDSPFFARFTHGVRYTGQLFPPEPPLPMRITFPARSQVSFPATVDLAPWAWKGAVDATLEWGFVFFGSPSPHGTLTVHLPAK